VKRVIGYILLGLLAFVAFLLITFPAQRAYALLNQQVPALRASGLSGTAWSGQAAVVQFGGRNLERLSWQLKPWSVLFGKLGLRVALNGTAVAGTADVALLPDGAVEVSDADLRLPGDELSSLVRMPVDLGGQFIVQIENARLQGNRLQTAEGQVQWQRAAVSAPVSQSLGEFSARLSTGDTGVTAQVKDEGGPLQLDGVALLKPDGIYSFKGHVSVRDPQQKMLLQGVQALGRPGPDGRVPLNYSGRL
jgi:general secretion pathway protein N